MTTSETHPESTEQAPELVLSSGFLAFARQAGFLAAVEDCGIEPEGLCGTSSGALAGALWCSGMTAKEVGTELVRRRPVTYLRPPTKLRGAFSLTNMVAFLRDHLPPTFAELSRPFGAGAMGPKKTPTLLTEGDLPTAVAASCAIPWLFEPIVRDGVAYQDGAMVDRLFLARWLEHRQRSRAVVHLVARTNGAAGEDPGMPHTVVHTPRSGAQLWSLGDFWGQYEETRSLARRRLG